MFNVIPSDTNLESLGDCAVYIKKELCNPTAANRLIDRAEQAALSLAAMPERFPFSRYSSLAAGGIRVCPVGSHCIFYSVDNRKQTVYLHLFGYSPRDWEVLF